MFLYFIQDQLDQCHIASYEVNFQNWQNWNIVNISSSINIFLNSYLSYSQVSYRECWIQ